MSIRRALFRAVVLSVALAGCSTGDGSATSTTAAGPTESATTATPTALSAASAKVSANSASESELVAALTAVGVPNADRWAREVMEYRPYPADDPALQKLQDNLAKYNPDAATLSGILAALEP